MKKTLILLLAMLLLTVPLAYAQEGGEDEALILYTTDDGAFAMTYLPDGWVYEGDTDALFVASSDAVMADDSDLVSGEMRIAVVPFPAADAEAMGATPTEQFQALLDGLTATPDDPNDPIVLGEIQDYPDYGEGALYVYGANSKEEADLLYYPIAPGYWALGFIGTVVGELETELGDIGWDVLSGVLYSLPLDTTFEGETFSFDLPAEWVINEDNAPIVYIVANSLEALLAPELLPDHMYFLVGDVGGAGIDIANLGLAEEATELAAILVNEEEVANEPFLIDVDGILIGVVPVDNLEGESVGGVMVAEIPDLGVVIGISYTTFAGRDIELVYTALRVLLSVTVNVE